MKLLIRMSLIKFIANWKHVTKYLTLSVKRFETRLVSPINWVGPFNFFPPSFWKPNQSGHWVETLTTLLSYLTLCPQCDKCKRMFVRDSPAPTVGQKYVGEDCPAVSNSFLSLLTSAANDPSAAISFHNLMEKTPTTRAFSWLKVPTY